MWPPEIHFTFFKNWNFEIYWIFRVSDVQSCHCVRQQLVGKPPLYGWQELGSHPKFWNAFLFQIDLASINDQVKQTHQWNHYIIFEIITESICILVKYFRLIACFLLLLFFLPLYITNWKVHIFWHSSNSIEIFCWWKCMHWSLT